MKKICFVGTAIQYAKKHHAIAEALEKECKGNVSFCYITYSKQSANFFKKKKLEHYYMVQEIKKIKLTRSLKEHLKLIEEKYEVDTDQLLFGDYEHSLMKQKRALTLLVKYFLFWERFLSSNHIDFILAGIERLKNLVPRYVSQKYDTLFCSLKASRITTQFQLNEDLKGRIIKLNRFWEKNKDKPLSKEDRSKSEKFFEEFIQQKKRVYIYDKPKILGKILFFFKRILNNVFIERFRNPYANVMHIAWFQVKKATRKYLVNKLYEKIDPNENIIFYPLHLENDAQLLIRAPQYADQVKTIKEISERIPKDYRLYVKEHPNNIGGMSISKLKTIKSLPNVKLVSPYIHSHDLIKNSSLIITINSTVGWEALFYKKPVIVLGTVFYDIFGMTWNSKIANLKKDIGNAVQKDIYDKETLLKAINAIFKSTYPGLANFKEKFRQKAMSAENLKRIANGIKQELNL